MVYLRTNREGLFFHTLGGGNTLCFCRTERWREDVVRRKLLVRRRTAQSSTNRKISELDSCCQPKGSWLCRMDMNPIHASNGLARNTRGVVVADVVVLAIGQIQDIQPKGDVVGYPPAHPQIGR
jgi:hypothetical protein